MKMFLLCFLSMKMMKQKHSNKAFGYMIDSGWYKVYLEGGRFYLCFNLDERKAIHVWRYDGRYIAEVYSFNHLSVKNDFIKEEDLDVLRFKSMLKAKEVGWNISSEDILSFKNSDIKEFDFTKEGF